MACSAIDFLLERFRHFPEKPALIWRDSVFPYDWLATQVAEKDARLEEDGVAPGSVVALLSDYSPESVSLLLALIGRRCIVAPLDPRRVGDLPLIREIGEIEYLFECAADGITPADFTATGRHARHQHYESLRTAGHPGLVLFSSGSTGTPKGAVHDLTALLRKYTVKRQDLCTLALLLFDHIGGLDTLFYCLSNSSTVVLVSDRSPEVVCEAIERYRVQVLPASPSFLNLLLLSGAHRQSDLSSLCYITYGAEMMPESALKRLVEELPHATILQKYGTTEVGTLRSRSRSSDSLWVKIGGEGYEWRVVDGKLQIKAQSAMLGYLNAPDPFTEDGWFITGDCVEVDGEYLRFLGRDSDIINVGGRKVYPTEVENVIADVPDVADAIVYGLPNPLLGHVVCAKVLVVGNESPETMRVRIRKHCAAELADYKVPARIVIADGPLANERSKKVRRSAGSRGKG